MRLTTGGRTRQLVAWMLLVPLPLLGPLCTGARAATVPVPATAVVELFTSEGCSDCPPADALLGELARIPGVVALAYHVTYWDALGWHDRFGLPWADSRQGYYVSALRLSTEFTPQAVVDGQVSLIGSDRGAIARALATRRTSVPVGVSLLHDRLRIELGAHPLPAAAQVLLIGYLPYTTTAVGAGENGGRKLEEFDVVRSHDVVGVWRGNATRFEVPRASLAAGVSRVAVLLQLPAGMIVGAATLAVR